MTSPLWAAAKPVTVTHPLVERWVGYAPPISIRHDFAQTLGNVMDDLRHAVDDRHDATPDGKATVRVVRRDDCAVDLVGTVPMRWGFGGRDLKAFDRELLSWFRALTR